MLHINYSCLFAWIFLNYLITSTFTEENSCTQISPCICEYNNGKLLDLTHLIHETQPFLKAQSNNFTYYFHPCSNEKLNITTPSVKNECNEPLSLCLVNKINSTSYEFIKLGDANDATFSPTKDGKPQLVYTIGKEPNSTTTIVTLSCSDIPSDYLFVIPTLVDQHLQHSLFLSSPWACLHTHQHGISVGSMLLVMFLVFVAVYFVGGALVLKFLRGAKGREMIPNLDFWLGLPGLVRDGILFIVSGCKPLNTADSYDRI